ncbi:MAG: TetR/AcrR family transcriptional regulator [Verrucomicrobia bacterium]|nr:TetR/AcrR family transcriptional regulator [Verrucomicrobiota bacterium]
MTADLQQSTRRQRLLDCAGALFSRWGFDKTSMDDIAREAGISKGAVYLEFPNKDALFKAVLQWEFARYTEDWLRRFEEDGENWSFARMVQHSLAAVDANPVIKALMMRDQRLFGSFLRRDKALVGLGISMRTELFAQLQEAGALRDDVPASTLAYLVSVTGYGLIAGAEVVPEENKVPFAEALSAWGLLLDRALTPARARNQKAARALLISMVQKVQTALRTSDKPGTKENGAA